MPIGPGTRVGPYEIVALLGEGGMGTVWRAHHAGLKRDDALKVLPDGFAADAERLARFQREAQVLASLNHPNIAHVYGLEQVGDVQALVMELVEGPTLAERIAHGTILVDETLPIARQIADALDAAHEQGIVHRDLKPANIKLRPDGIVKVLDFGLAKLAQASGPGPQAPDISGSPTMTSPAMTRMGVILGTAAYMAPEQARGKAVDKRADIWAFGCVVYEALTGRRAFPGDNMSEVLSGVIKSDVDWKALPTETPPTLRAFLQCCLQKDPRERLRDIGDARLALDGAFETAATEAILVAPPRLRVWQRPAAAAIIALAIAATAGLAVGAALTRVVALPVQLLRFTVSPASRESLAATNSNDPDVAVSPDGTRIVYVAFGGTSRTQQLYVRALDQLEARVVEGLEAPRSPFVSPGGNWIGFFSEPNVLRKVPVNGGPAVTICEIDAGPRGASWGAGDTIVFATNNPATGLFRVSAGGGEAELLTKPDAQKGELDHYWPELLPGGRAVLFTIVSTAGRVQSTQIAVLNLQTGEQKVLVPGGSYARYAPTGHIVYGVEGTLRAVAFDPDRLELRSDPVPVLEGVVTKASGAASFAVAQDGSLVYLAHGIQGAAERTLVWVDRQGREEALEAPPRAYTSARISPDGTRLVLEVRDQQNDIWVWDLGRETLTRLTFGPGIDISPIWTPDGQRIVFGSAGVDPSLYWQAADGTGAVERLTETELLSPQVATSFSPDGTLLFDQAAPATGTDIYIARLDGERRATTLVRTPFGERYAGVSADGRWVAYESNESGRSEVYVQPFPNVSTGKWTVSTGGGLEPLWARDGRELFYRAPAGGLMAVSIQSGSTFAAGRPRLVFKGRYAVSTFGRGYDVAPDGQRFLMIKENESAGRTSLPELVVVQHWIEELKRLVPTN